MTSIAERRRRRKARITLPGGQQIDQKPTGRDRVDVGQRKQAEDARRAALEARLRVAGIPTTPEALKAAVAPDFEIPPTHRVMCVNPHKEPTMKKLILTAALSLIGSAALAETPNRTTMSFPEFVEASGCVIVDKGGYQNLAAADGGNCPFAVTQAWYGNYSKATPGADGILGTADDGTASDN